MGGAPQGAMRVTSQIWQVVFASQTLQVFCLAFRKKAQYVVVMTKTNVANESVCFRTDGVIIFQGFKKWCHHKDDAKPCSIYEWCALYGTLHKLSRPNFEQFEFGGKN